MGFSDFLGSIGKTIGNIIPSADKIGSLFADADFLGPVLQTGAGLFQGLSSIDAQKEQEDRLREANKFSALIELAKLKYGAKGGGGGGGTLRNKNADLIEVLSAGTDDELKALSSLSSNYVGALK